MAPVSPELVKSKRTPTESGFPPCNVKLWICGAVYIFHQEWWSPLVFPTWCCLKPTDWAVCLLPQVYSIITLAQMWAAVLKTFLKICPSVVCALMMWPWTEASCLKRKTNSQKAQMLKFPVERAAGLKLTPDFEETFALLPCLTGVCFLARLSPNFRSFLTAPN